MMTIQGMKYKSDFEAKKAILDIGRRMYAKGFVASNDGNISCRVGPNTIWTTPTGVSKGFMTQDMLVKMDLDGKVLMGRLKPSSEIKMHLRCYKEREDVGAVLHAHPPVATGYAVANKPLDEYSMIETVIALGSIPVTPYGTPSTYEVPDRIAPYLGEHDALLLQNHGALTVGADLITAYYRMETLELFAKISLNAYLLGGAKEISRENIDRLISMREGYQVTGRHPGYRKYGK